MFPEQGILNNNEITIQLSLDGFSYVIYNQTLKKFVHLERIAETNPSLALAIQNIEATHSCQIADFARITVVFDNCQNTFVPKTIFDNDTEASYLDFLGIGGDDRTAASDSVGIADAYNVFTISNSDAATLEEMPENTRFYHSASVLVSSLIKDNIRRTHELAVYINVKNQQFDMIATKGCKLLFYNTFSFKTKEDFLYFLLFSIEQLHFDAATVPVYFLGMIEERSQIVELVSRYIRDIRFVRRDNDIAISEELENTPFYYNYLIFNTLTCELLEENISGDR